MPDYTLREIGPKLACGKYSKRKFGVGFAGGPGFLFISPPPGQDFEPEDFSIVQKMVAGYNAGLKVEARYA